MILIILVAGELPLVLGFLVRGLRLRVGKNWLMTLFTSVTSANCSGIISSTTCA